MKKSLIIGIIIVSLFANFNVHNTKADTGTYLIKSIPSGAAVYVNEEYVGITPYELTTNNTIIRIAKGGYFEITQKITSLIGEETLSLIKLQKRSALYLKGDPSQTSYSIKETQKTGQTPDVIDNLEAGSYTLVFSKNGFKSLTKKISLNGGLTVITIDLTSGTITQPVKEYSDITINTNVIACQIFLDGVNKGLSPLILKNLEIGKIYKIEAKKTNYNSASTNYTIEKNGLVTLILTTTQLVKEYSDITINTNVIACQIFLDGVNKGLSPLVLKNLEIGKMYKVEAKKTNYNSASTNYTVEKNGLITLILTIKDSTPIIKYTSLNVKTSVATCNIYINGINHIGNNITVSGLKVGAKTEIRVTKTGYMTQTRTVTLKDGNNSASFILKKVTPPKILTSLVIDSVPGSATVFLTSTGLPMEKGTTPIKLQGLIVGMQYVIMLQEKGYKSLIFKFTARENGTPLIFNLTPLT